MQSGDPQKSIIAIGSPQLCGVPDPFPLRRMDGISMNTPLKKLQLRIHNIHCAACEVRIERNFKEIPGVTKVRVRHATGRAEVFVTGREPRLRDFDQAVKADGYSVSWWDDGARPFGMTSGRTKQDYAEIGAIFLFVLAGYLILQRFDLLPKGLAITKNMSYGFIFLMGVVAAFSSCLAVTGGLLLAVAAKYNERHPNLSGLQKFKPTLFFNIGRVLSYTLLGGAVGALGSVFTFSQRGTAILSILASAIMIILGFQLLNLFPWMRRFQPAMPKFISHRIHDWSSQESNSKFTPLALGASTFFLPCGFTQALQFYVLSTGSAVIGALTMLAFSLGTLPSLLSLSAISSFARGSFQKHFLRFAGVLVIVVGFWNINNGFALAGINLSFASFMPDTGASDDDTGRLAQIVGGFQIANMRVDGYDYSPARFMVQEGMPVKWRIDGRNAVACAQVVLASSLGVAKFLSPDGITTITFTPKETGEFSFSCPMGMTTSGAQFTVVPRNPNSPPPATVAGNADDSEIPPAAGLPVIPSQKLSMQVTYDQGFYPRSFTVKKGVPIELTVNDKVPLGGCMSVMVIPKYEVTVPFHLGENKVSFTPTEAGTVYGTCSMGSRMVRFDVID
jgi:sulfite exporter TauE/SafE/copper chaperone CopZ